MANEKNFPAIGDHVLYKNNDSYELGKVKSVNETEGTARIWFSEGDTAALTPLDTLVELRNARTIKRTNLGGHDAGATWHTLYGYAKEITTLEPICSSPSLPMLNAVARSIVYGHFGDGEIFRSEETGKPFDEFVIKNEDDVTEAHFVP